MKKFDIVNVIKYLVIIYKKVTYNLDNTKLFI